MYGKLAYKCTGPYKIVEVNPVVRQCLEGKYCRCLLTCGLHECSSMVLIGAAHMTVGAVPKETK